MSESRGKDGDPSTLEWTAPEDALLPSGIRDLIDAGVTAVAAEGEQDHYAAIVKRLLPDIDVFSDLAGDAWETIAGDVEATLRFNERLQSMDSRGQCATDLQNWQGRGSAEDIDDVWNPHAMAELRERLSKRRRRAPAEWSIVPIDGAALLIMAGVHAGEGDQWAIHRNLGIVLEQLAAYDRLRPVVAEARPALRADNERGRTVLRALLARLERELNEAPRPAAGVPWSQRAAGLPQGRAELDRWLLAVDTLLAWQHIWSHPAIKDKDAFYTITVSPKSGCAGDTLTLTGGGFGVKPGKVRFRVPAGKGQNDILAIGPSSYVDVVAQSWTDTKIQVVIPTLASCGRLAIRIPTGPVQVHGKKVATYKSVGPIVIGATLPEVLDLRADAVAGQLVTAPGTLVKVNWSVCPDDSTVTLEAKKDGKSLWTQTTLPPSSSDIIPVGGTKTTNYEVTLTAQTKCGSASKKVLITVHKKAKIYLDALEITQATQFFWGGTTLKKRVNGVPLIAGKPTLVRAYLGTTQDPSFNHSEVSGAQVTLRGFLEGGGELPGSPLQPINAGALSGRNLGMAFERADLRRTANFIIPQNWILPGPSYRLEASVMLPGTSLDSVDAKYATARLQGVRFHAPRPLDVVVVLVDYTGKCSAKWPNCNGPPTMADVAKTLLRIRDIFPSNKMRIWLPGKTDQILKYAGNKNCGNCGGFSCILEALSDRSKDYDNDDDMVWWGAVKNGVGGTGGCGSDSKPGAYGFATFRVRDDDTAWHEFGHAYGRDHSFEDGSYPKYGYANSDSIGEYGVDVAKLLPWNATECNKHLYSPYSATDYMSYEPAPTWVSPYTYMSLMQSFFAKKASGSSVVTSIPGAKYLRHRQERLMVCGTLRTETGEVSLEPLYHLPMYPKNGRGRLTRYELALLDGEGRMLVAEPLRLSEDQAHGPHEGRDKDGSAGAAEGEQALPPLIRISQTLLFDDDAAALVVREGVDVLHKVERPQGRPSVSDVTIEQEGRDWRLTWRSDHPENVTLLQGVAVTYDDGERWQRLRKRFSRSELRIDPESLAGGERCRFRVFATDGFNTTYGDSEVFAAPLQPPLIVPLEPDDGAMLPSGVPVRLHAEAISPRFGSLDGESVRWTSDVQGELGTGPELLVRLQDGDHVLTIAARTDAASVAEETIQVRVG